MGCLLLLTVFAGPLRAEWQGGAGEKTTWKFIATESFRTFQADRRCHDRSAYRIYLIDNFEQPIRLVPEVATSHSEMLVRLLRAGRDDLDIRVLNTSLSKGLTRVLHDLVNGACVDAVVSAIPGSNYTYDQISSLFEYRRVIGPENILYHRRALRELLRDIALRPSTSIRSSCATMPANLPTSRPWDVSTCLSSCRMATRTPATAEASGP